MVFRRNMKYHQQLYVGINVKRQNYCTVVSDLAQIITESQMRRYAQISLSVFFKQDNLKARRFITDAIPKRDQFCLIGQGIDILW